ncbi:DUF397 domain-containing protein [Actinomadura bangladeshensis]|uniref:DUF397 domain-containing protein n=1 Tax=Actinomadura bangladeshensis TaxID=453573 RepID=A0A4R4NEC3_9ACTN|nr:DUF397 domain-containing protein [Actinomadura bangladeshensis]
MVEIILTGTSHVIASPDGSCVEISLSLSNTIGIRDSMVQDTSPILELTRREWTAFLDSIRMT